MTNVTNGNGHWRKWGVISSIVIFFLFQSGGAIWWASNVNAKMVNIQDKLRERTKDRYYKEEANKDFAIRDVKISALEERMVFTEKHLFDSISDLKESIKRIEVKMDTYIFDKNKG